MISQQNNGSDRDLNNKKSTDLFEIPQRFLLEKKRIVSKLLQNPLEFGQKINSGNSEIPTDRDCIVFSVREKNWRCSKSNENRQNIRTKSKSFYRSANGCKNCQQTSSLSQLKENYKFRKFSATRLIFRCDYKMSDNNRLILAQHQNFVACGVSLEEKISYFQLDSFTLQTVVSLLVEAKMKQSFIVSAYVCGYNGYFITKKLLSLSELTKEIQLTTEVVVAIIRDVLNMLTVLKNYNFIYGSSEIRFSLDGEVKTYLSDFTQSSISVNNFRLIPENNLNILRIKRFFSQDLVVRSVRKTQTNSEEVQTDLIFSVNPRFARLISRSGIPMFVGSLDFYLIILKLMTNKKFYQVMRNDPNLNQIWEKMWLAEEFDLIDVRIRNYSDDVDISVLYDGLSLRCDVLQRVQDQIFTFFPLNR